MKTLKRRRKEEQEAMHKRELTFIARCDYFIKFLESETPEDFKNVGNEAIGKIYYLRNKVQEKLVWRK